MDPIRSKGVVTWDDSRRRFLAKHCFATLLRHCFEQLQHCSNIATLYKSWAYQGQFRPFHWSLVGNVLGSVWETLKCCWLYSDYWHVHSSEVRRTRSEPAVSINLVVVDIIFFSIRLHFSIWFSFFQAEPILLNNWMQSTEDFMAQ